MSHFTRTIPDSILVRGYVTTGANLADIDVKTASALNGDGGGTWTPSTLIEINGAGAIVAGPWTLSGAAVTASPPGGSVPTILFNRGTAGDYFGLAAAHTGASPVVHTGLFEYLSVIPGVVIWFGGLLPTVKGARFFTPLSVYSGAASITSVEISWRVREAHANIPQYLPRMRVIAVADDGTVYPLRAKDATTDVDGFQYLPTPLTGAAYYNLGAIQVWTYTCNIVLPVDSSRYIYFVEFIEESGTNSWTSSGSSFVSANTHFALLTIFDGRN